MRKAILAGLCLLSVLIWTATAATSPNGPILNRGDGSRARAVHRIPLFTEAASGEKPEKITAKTDPALPFSARRTCSECHIYEHNYDMIRKGWHFNATDPNVPSGRPGQPWIYVDAATGTQVPLSYRAWPGTFKPDQLGISPFKFTELFGRQMPGGGAGELDSKVETEIPRQMVSGPLEINCLSCHDRDPAHDQAEFAAQVEKQNLRWAATASAGFGAVSGSAKKMDDTFDYRMPDTVTNAELIPQVPTVAYRPNTFDHKDNVFFDVSGKPLSDRCYFCHSEINVSTCGTQAWQADEDVHMTSGMTCVDCHREGLEHNTIRGYEGEVSTNVLAARTTCKGCHLGNGGQRPEGGRLGAPVPKHKGIPVVHFEKLSCTACHAGPWPVNETFSCKTSQAHALGTHNVNKSPDALPHVFYPVYAKQTWTAKTGDGSQASRPKIGPHRLIWPAYWGILKEDKVQPVDLAMVAKEVGPALKDATASRTGNWAPLKSEQIAQALKALGEVVKEKAVYVAGGVLYRLGDDGKLLPAQKHPAADPYMWPIAHNVRPAAQSLGVDQCNVCHSKEAPFFFSKVSVDSPVQGDPVAPRVMASLYEADGPVNVRVNHFFRWLIIIVMTLLILHIMGDLYRRTLVWLGKKLK